MINWRGLLHKTFFKPPVNKLSWKLADSAILLLGFRNYNNFTPKKFNSKFKLMAFKLNEFLTILFRCF